MRWLLLMFGVKCKLPSAIFYPLFVMFRHSDSGTRFVRCSTPLLPLPMMNGRALPALIALSAILTGCQTKYRLFDGHTVRARALCGQDPCPAGSLTGRHLSLNRVPYAPAVSDSTTVVEVARQVVGGMVPEKARNGIPLACGTQGAWAFAPNDIVPLANVGGYEATYKRIDTLKIDVDAQAKADVAELRAAGRLAAALTDAEATAKLKATYEKLKGSEVEVKSRYYQYGLSPQALQGLLAQSSTYALCTARLRDRVNPYEVIGAAGILWTEISFKSGTAQSLAASVEAALKQDGVDVDLTARIRRKFSESLNATRGPGFQVLTLRMIDKDILVPVVTPLRP